MAGPADQPPATLPEARQALHGKAAPGRGQHPSPPPGHGPSGGEPLGARRRRRPRPQPVALSRPGRRRLLRSLLLSGRRPPGHDAVGPRQPSPARPRAADRRARGAGRRRRSARQRRGRPSVRAAPGGGDAHPRPRPDRPAVEREDLRGHRGDARRRRRGRVRRARRRGRARRRAAGYRDPHRHHRATPPP